MTVTKPQNATLIDSISEGYTAINRRPWLLLLPLLLNVYLWFGPQLSFAPLVSDLDRFRRSATGAQAVDPEQQEQLELSVGAHVYKGLI